MANEHSPALRTQPWALCCNKIQSNIYCLQACNIDFNGCDGESTIARGKKRKWVRFTTDKHVRVFVCVYMWQDFILFRLYNSCRADLKAAPSKFPYTSRAAAIRSISKTSHPGSLIDSWRGHRKIMSALSAWESSECWELRKIPAKLAEYWQVCSY